jgi:Type ISP C-terminal specificity domain
MTPEDCGSALDPMRAISLTAGWGHAGKGGVTMPAKGKVTMRGITAAERPALPDGAIEILGEQTCDVWLNDRVYWRNIPLPVWEYTLGGYQVVKKWLSYCESELLRRPLRAEEARYITEMVRRIAAILLLSPSLDASYSSVKQAIQGQSQAVEA